MSKKNVHVVPRGGGDSWAVKKAGNDRASSVHPTQEKAINAAIPVAKKEGSGVVIHRPDGRIRDSDSYGNESPVKDNKH